ncbi:HEAT repeat domain-containing protein [candidate division KSB1 bacterium]
MQIKLLHIIVEGPPEEREEAAREICQRRMDDMLDRVVGLLEQPDEDVRVTAAAILGVFGRNDTLGILDSLSKGDPALDVRVAAIISRQYAGKLTYDHLMAEIKRFQKSEAAQKDMEPDLKDAKAKSDKPDDVVFDTRPEPRVRRLADLEEEALRKERTFSIASILAALGTVLRKNKIYAAAAACAAVVIIVFIFTANDDEASKPEIKPGSALLGNVIKERIAGITEFKAKWLDPDSPDSRYPMTLEIRTMGGDTYGGLFDNVYSGIIPTKAGINTLGAFWRHINFGTDRKQNEINLMEKETSGELLLFPNFAALNLLLQAEEESLAMQQLFGQDPDLEVRIEVNDVLVR